MASSTPWLFQLSRVGDVAVVEITSRELIGPDVARHLGEQLDALVRAGERRLLLDFSQARTMTSTVYAALLIFRRRVDEAGGELMACSMSPSVRLGADILSLGRFIPIHDDEASALAAFDGPGASA